MSIQTILSLVISLGVLVGGCVSDPAMPSLNYPLPLLEKAIQNALVKVKTVSQNRREFVSDYLTKEGRIWDPIGNDPQRAVVKVFIVGDRRPYDIDIETSIEERPTSQTGGSTGFKEIGKSSRLSQEIQFRIQTYVRQNSKRNLIDDFRPF